MSSTFILDCGAGFTKAGFANKKEPSLIFPSVTSSPLLKDLTEPYVGYEAINQPYPIPVTFPIQSGRIQNWNEAIDIWDYAINHLKITPPNNKILITRESHISGKQLEKTLEVIFEKYQFESLQCAPELPLILYSQAHVSGIALECGHSSVRVGRVTENVINDSFTFPFGGHNITLKLCGLLLLSGNSINRSADYWAVNKMKEELCYVALNPNDEEKLAMETTFLTKEYKMPDGRTLKVGRERFFALEGIFNPTIFYSKSPSLTSLMFNTVRNLPEKKSINLVLSGGSSCFPGFTDRLLKELGEKRPPFVVKHSKYGAFEGAVALSQFSETSPDNFWINRKEYNEEGVSIQRKFI